MRVLRTGSGTKTEEERKFEIESAKLFGRHVSREKGYLLLWFTLLAAASPVLMGLRLWNGIPETVPSGLIGVGGEDDSLTRWAVVFVLPGLMCLLNLICHMQFLMNQRRETLPPIRVRLLGRWGFPIISVLFCSGMMRQAAGKVSWLPIKLLLPLIAGLLLMMLGGHFWDCRKDAAISLRFMEPCDDASWQKAHRCASVLCLAAGLCMIVLAECTAGVA